MILALASCLTAVAMGLRDSGAQVWPYIQLAPEDEHLRNMLAGHDRTTAARR